MPWECTGGSDEILKDELDREVEGNRSQSTQDSRHDAENVVPLRVVEAPAKPLRKVFEYPQNLLPGETGQIKAICGWLNEKLAAMRCGREISRFPDV